jgi:hypothetical protein
MKSADNPVIAVEQLLLLLIAAQLPPSQAGAMRGTAAIDQR